MATTGTSTMSKSGGAPTRFGQLIEQLMDEATRDGTSRREVARRIGMNLGSIDAVISATKPGQVWPSTIAALSRLGMTPMALCRVVFEQDLGTSFDGGSPAGGPVLTPEQVELIQSAQPDELRAVLGLLREMRQRRP